MSKKQTSLKDNEIVITVIYSQEIFSVFRYGIDGPTHWWMSFTRFSPVDAFKCVTNLLHKKCILQIVLKTSFVYCSLNSANLYTFKHLNNGGSIQNDNTDSKCEIFYRREQMPQSQSVVIQPKL